MNRDDEPKLNPELQRLAEEAARAEEGEPEPGEAPQIETRDERAEAARALAEQTARWVVSGLATGVKMAYGVEYQPELKAQAVEKLAPCFEGDGEPPEWLAEILGEYGAYLEAGAFFAGVGLQTYQTIQADKQKQQREKAAREADQKPEKSQTDTQEPASTVYGVDG